MIPRRLFLIGASNSIVLGGYAATLDALLSGDGDHLVKLPIGANTSLTELYRLSILPVEELPTPRDVMTWEHALNDANQIDLKAYNEEELLQHVEQTIEFCRVLGVPFVGIILTPQDIAAAGYHSYRAKLKFLFDYYGVPYLDVLSAYSLRNEIPTIPDEQYRGFVHYMPRRAVTQFIAEWCHRFGSSCTAITWPGTPAYLFLDEARKVEFIAAFDGGSAEILSNQLLSAPVCVNGKSNVTVSPRVGAGQMELVSEIAPTGFRSNAALEIRGDRETFGLPFRNDTGQVRKSLVRNVIVSATTAGPIIFGRQNPMNLRQVSYLKPARAGPTGGADYLSMIALAVQAVNRAAQALAMKAMHA